MKPNKQNRLLPYALASAIASLLATSVASATVYYWDSDGATAGFGNTTGTWGTSAFWSTVAAGTGATANTTITTADQVNIGTATLNYGNATIAAGNVNVNGIIFGAGQTTAVTLGTAANTITFGGTTPTITVNGSGSHTISSIMAGSAGIIKDGTGTLVPGNNGNTFTGGLSIKNGTINVGANGGSVGASAISMGGAGSTGATLLGNATVARALGVNTPTSGAITLAPNTSGNSLTYSGAITLNAGATLTARAFFNTATTGTGTTTVSGGVTGTGNLIIDNTGQNTAGTSKIVVSTAAVNPVGSITARGNNVGTGALTTISSVIGTNVTSFTKEGLTPVTLSGTNTFTSGVTISGGALTVGSAGALNSTAGSQNAVTFGASAASTATLILNGNSVTVRNLTTNATPGTPIVQNVSATSATLTVGNSLNLSGTYAGTLQNGTGAGTLALTKAGTGTLTLSGLNSFTGNVTVSGGTLAAAVAGAGGNSAFGSVVSTRTLNVNTGGTLRFDVGNVFNNNFASASTSLPALSIAGGTVTNGGTATNSALGNVTLAGGTLTATLGSASGYGSWNLNGTVTSTGTSTISTSAGVPITLSASSANSNTTTFDVTSGTLTASAALGEVSASGDERVSGFTKTGAGTLVLSGVNTYTGNAAINVGAVSIATTDALPGFSTNGRYSVALDATLAVQNAVTDSDVTAMLATTNFASGANFGFDTAAGSRTVSLNLVDTANGPLGIVKLGANTLTLTGTNTYTGGTDVLAGSLSIPSTSVLPGWNVDGGFLIASGASLVVPNAVSESEVNTILGTTNIASGASLVFDTSAGDRTHTTAITNTTQGLLNVGKIGGNALTLAGDNTHTGNTTVTSGTLNITGSLTGLAASSNLSYGNAAGNTIVNISGSVNDYKNFTGANNAGSIAVMNQTGGSASTLGTNSADTQWVAQNGGYGYLNITGGTFNTGRFDAVGTTGGGTAVVYVGGTGTLNNNSGDWLILPRKEGVGQLTVGPGGSLVRTAAVTANLAITMDASNAHGALNIAGGNVDTGVRPIQFGFGSAAYTNTRGFVNLAGGTLSVGSAIIQSNTTVGGQYSEYFNFGGGTLKSNAAITWLPAANAVGHTITATLYGAVTNNNNANSAFNTQIGTTSNFSGGLTIDTNNFATNIAYPLSGAGGVGVTQADIGDVSLLSGNSGYIGAPAVVFSPPSAPGGVPASGYAVIDVGSGKVNGIVITNPGTYAASETPTVTLTGGGGSIAPFTTSALATANTSGSLTKIGAGTLTLSGASTYTGATSVNVGTLNLSGSLASNVTVANGANLSGEGSTTGSLTFSGTSDLAFDPSSPGALAAASVDATGATVTVAPSVPVTGTGIVVLSAPGGITGTAGGVGNNFIYTGRGSLYISGTQLLIDTAPAALAWRGNDGTNPTFWDLNTTTNWESVGPVAEKFFTGDAITFDDTATSYTVDISTANVFPGNITFSNIANTYTIQGAFGIFGGATVTQSGTGTTVLNSSNGYTGTTTVNAGVLNIRNASALGSTTAGTSVTSGAALEIQGGITTAAEPLTLNGPGISSNGALRNISGNNTWGTAVTLATASSIGVDADTLVIPSVAGAFGLTKVGAGTLNITGASAATPVTVEAGTLYMGAQSGASTTTTLGAATAVTLNNSSNLTIRRSNTGGVDPAGVISGNGSLTLLGDNATTSASGDFTLNNASTFTGGTTVTGARAAITTSGTALGTGTITTGTNGQVFVSTTALTVDNDFILGSGLGWNEPSGYLGALRLNGTTLTGDISLTSNARITSAGTSTLSGIISGSFGMDFFEDNAIGTISLSGVNTYTGTTTVNSMGSGTTFPNLIVSNNNALGTTDGGTTLYGTGTTGNGTQLTLANGITVTDETLTMDSTASGYRASLITAANGTAVWDGNVVTAGANTILGFNTNGATSNLTVGSSDTDTITGTSNVGMRGTGVGTINSSINLGTAGIFKTDGGIWTITSNNNSFTGTPIMAGGILSVSTIADSGTNSALGAGTSLTLGQNSATAGTLRFTGASGGSSNRALLLNNGTTGGAGVIENTVSGQTLTLSGPITTNAPASSSTLTLAGAGDGVLSGSIASAPALNLSKSGAGTWTVSGTNTYTGNTTVTAGTLNVTGSLTGNTTTSTLALGTAATNTVVNVSNDMTLFAVTGANIAGSNTVYNQTAGIVNVYKSGVGSSGSFVSNIGYGYFNLTGGTFKSNGSFSIGCNNAASNAVAYVGGTGILDWSGSGPQTLSYASAASLTVGPGGSVSRGGSTGVTWLATNSGSSAIINVAGGSLNLGTAGSLRVNNTASGGTSVTLNVAAGTLTMGLPLATNGSTSGSLFANYAGGTLKASANLAGSPLNVLTSVATVFGAIDNVGTAQDFTGGMTIDTDGFSMPYATAIRGAAGNGVKQGDIAITGGSGYIGAPLVQFTGGTLTPNGTPASGYAVVSGGAVTEIVITSPGTYLVDPVVTLTGGGGSGAIVALSALTPNAADTGLTKSGAGTLTLSGANSYVGGTTVNAGTLTLGNASALGTGSASVIGGSLDLGGQATTNDVSIGASGTLTGAGSVGAATLAGTVTPGGAGSGLITMASATVASTSSIALQLATAGVRGTNYDALTVSGALALDGTITVSLNGLTPAGGQSFDLIDSTGPIDVTNFTVSTDLILPALGGGLTWDTSTFASTGIVTIVSGDPYNAWASGYGLTGGDALKSADPDNDGVNNLLEFATNANPTSGASGARVYAKMHTLGGDSVLTYTIASRKTAVFAANGSKQEAIKDLVKYTLEASNELTGWTSVVVTEVTGGDATAVQAAITPALPALDADWEWHTFRTDDGTSVDPSDYIRLKVAEAP
jgi:fibronectin-binding autotransporter adhesin